MVHHRRFLLHPFLLRLLPNLLPLPPRLLLLLFAALRQHVPLLLLVPMLALVLLLLLLLPRSLRPLVSRLCRSCCGCVAHWQQTLPACPGPRMHLPVALQRRQQQHPLR